MKNNPSVIFEDNHLLVVFKPSGWLSQGDKTGDLCMVEWGREYIRKKYDKPGNVFCGLPHRLDRPVSGVMVLAKTSKSLERLNKMFLDQEVQKTYYALVERRPEKEEDTLVHWLKKDTQNNSSKAFKKEKNGSKKAILDYRLLFSSKEYNLLEVMPKTGRPHQIRVQLATMKCPIIGDKKYGGIKMKDFEGSIALHASRISFIHPVKKEPVRFDAPLKKNEFMKHFNVSI